MENKFLNELVKFDIKEGDWILVAVSTGVDSMVLLTLLLKLKTDFNWKIGVAHIHHHVRQQSDEEVAFLNKFCEVNKIPCYVGDFYYNGGNFEAEAREFRYNFLTKQAELFGYQKIVTAHHADDHLETLLMQLTRGVQPNKWNGVKKIRNLGEATLVRPLLNFTKDTLIQYAQQQHIVYYEDETNHSVDFFRNRIRMKVIPELQQANPQVAQQISNFQKQVANLAKLVQPLVDNTFNQIVSTNLQSFELDLAQFAKQSPELQGFLINEIFSRMCKEVPFEISQHKAQLTNNFLLNSDTQGELDLGSGWYVLRRYTVAVFTKEKQSITIGEAVHYVKLGDMVKLSDNEWLDFAIKGSERIPTGDWNSQIWTFSPEIGDQLKISQACLDDVIQIDRFGHHKKVRRLFIDKKIPREKRQSFWKIENKLKKILGILLIRKSYLCIAQETDKIQYIITYYYK